MLNFLSRLPNKYLLLLIFLVIFAAYLVFQTDFLANLARESLVAVLTLLGAQKGMEAMREWQKRENGDLSLKKSTALKEKQEKQLETSN